MRVGVTEWAETIIVLLSRRIPQGKLNMFSINFDIGHIVLEHGGNVNLAGGTLVQLPNTLIPRAVSMDGARHAPSESPSD